MITICPEIAFLSLSLSVSLLTYFSKVKCAVITWKTLVISFLLNWTPQTQILSLKHTQLYTLSETPIHTHTHSMSMIHFSVLTTSVYFPSCLMTQLCHVSRVQSRAGTAGIIRTISHGSTDEMAS